jgi:endonuclease YncB( thermonuclease family)
MTEIVRPDFRRRETPLRRARGPRRRLFDTPIPVTVIVCVSLAIALYGMAPKGMLGLNGDAPSSVLDSPQIHVVDGDTVRSGGRVFRLVGFNTPETGDNAQCAEERALGARATARLQELVAAGRIELERRACACRPGTEGTEACNYGRLCAKLSTQGRDAGSILIAEGLAERYVCGGTSCPRRRDWCGG